MAEVLDSFTPYFSEVRLLPSSKGRFEVTVDDTLIFSKVALDRHAEPGEVTALVGKTFGLVPIPLTPPDDE